MEETFDLVILGSGSTAFAAALTAQELNRTVVMTEERPIGGTCVNRGCLPSKIVLLLRLSPIIPFNALNYALSLSKVKVRTYVLASFLGMLPGTAMWVYLGSLAPAAAELSSAASGGGMTRTVLYIAGLAATVAAAVIGARAAKRALEAQLQEPTSL